MSQSLLCHFFGCEEDDMFSLGTESSMQMVSNVESHHFVRVDSALDNDIFPISFSLTKVLRLKTYRRWLVLRVDMSFGKCTKKMFWRLDGNVEA